MDDDREPPKLSLASRKTDEELQLRRAMAELETAIRELAANIIRIIRGAGEPLDLFDQFNGVARAINSAPENTSIYQVNRAMAEALQAGLDDCGGDNLAIYTHQIERGALRKVAARLLNQQLQVACGDNDLWHGILGLERERENVRRGRRRDPTWADLEAAAKSRNIARSRDRRRR